MPKPSSSTAQSPAADKKLSDIALRKKKNADAQAAFRARRANYINTLEDTVEMLEEVVEQLQASHQDACLTSHGLQQENSRLKHELREREKFWRWQTRKTGQAVGSDDPVPLSTYFPLSQPPDGPTSHTSKYGNGDIEYPINDNAPISNVSYEDNPSHFTDQRPSSLCPGTDSQVSGENTFTVHASKSSHFSCSVPATAFLYPMCGMSKESSWPPSTAQSVPSSDSGGADHPAHFVVSPTLTSTSGSFSPGEQKVHLDGLNTAPYSFPNSRSISPTVSTPSSSSSTLVSPFQFSFPDNTGHDSSDNHYRRHSHPHTAEITLHGGTADVSFTGASASDRPLFPMLPPISESDPGTQQAQGGNHPEPVPYLLSRLRIRRGLTNSRSRSPSPTAPALCSTVAVIKAQAFGALRRTRTRNKKSSEGASRVAMNVLKARGISTNTESPVIPSLKRQRLDEELNG